jgi:hypothetical protein
MVGVPNGPPGSNPIESTDEDFDNAPYSRTSTGQRALGAGLVVIGLLLILLGVLRSSGFDSYVEAGFGLALILIVVLARPAVVARVTISDAALRMRFANGRSAEIRWDTPNLVLRLSHAVRGPSGKPVEVSGRALKYGKVEVVVTDVIGDAIARRAQRLGLAVSTSQERFAVRGRPSTLEVVTILHLRQ